MAHVNLREYFSAWLPAALLACGVALFGLPVDALALVRIEPFQATVPLADRSEAAQTAAFQAALRSVLVRVTGRRGADEESVFAPLVSNARRYVQQYRSAPDDQLSVTFDGPAIERWLAQNGQPLWGRERPSTLVWLMGPAGVVSTDDASELKDAIDAAAQQRGIPLIWPNAAAASAGTAAEMARRLGADGVLVGHANGMTSASNVRWTLQYQDRSSEFAGALEGVNRAADLYASLFAASGNLAPVDIQVSGIEDLQDYAGVEDYLESFTFITHVGVEALRGDLAVFRLTTRGGIEPLAHTLALTGKLLAVPTCDAGMHCFQLRR